MDCLKFKFIAQSSNGRLNILEDDLSYVELYQRLEIFKGTFTRILQFYAIILFLFFIIINSVFR